MNNFLQKGQIALIVLLIMAGVLTLGLATSKKVVVDTKLDKDEEMLKQAFNAAESGIDTYLGSGKTKYVASDNGSRATVNIAPLGTGSTLTSGGVVSANYAMIFWLVPHDAVTKAPVWGSAYSDSSVTICARAGFNGSLRIGYFYKESLASPDFGVDRFVYNLSNTGNMISNGIFSSPGSKGSCPESMVEVVRNLDLHNSINKAGFISVIPVFGNTPLALVSDAGTAFPQQGEQINSVGSVGDVNQQFGASRSVSVQRVYGARSSLMQFILEGLESGGGISNQ